MFTKLSFKIGLLFFTFILLIETLLFFILYTNLANDRVNEVMDSLLSRGNTHRDVLEDYYNQTTLEHVGIMESASEFIVVITDENGDIIVASNPVTKEMKRVMERANREEIPQDGAIIEEEWRKTEYIATDSPITINHKHKGHVFMFAHSNDVKKIVDHLSDQFIIIGLITIGLTIITIFILSRFIALPLIKMKEATEQLSKGRHTVTLRTDREDELGELANSITKLSNDLEQMKNERNEFLASISHELRTPLTYIKGYADIINRSNTSEAEIKEYTTIIYEEAEQLTSLINSLFELAKMDQNSFVIHREDVVLYDLIQSVASRMRPLFAEKNIKFTVDCPKNVIVSVDPHRFQQVLMNILDNAKKNSFEDDQVTLEVKTSKDHLVIIISDEGEGVPEADLPYLFNRLYRVEKSRSRESGGTGLGLAIVKEIIDRHGGTVKAINNQGKGMSFIITLEKE